jgi:hypothetical protein
MAVRALVSLALFAFASSATPLLADETFPTAKAAGRRWVYRGTVDAPEPRTPLELALVETGRRTIDGRLYVELAVEVHGKRIQESDLESLGLAGSPFGIFAPTWILVFDKGATHLIAGTLAEPATPRAFGMATWRITDRKKQEPRHVPEDRDSTFHYGKKINSWPSQCAAYVHPSPDTGDFYNTEHCFAPGVGITQLRYQSVWGSYEFELVAAPESPALP